jgi:hypothetical protein
MPAPKPVTASIGLFECETLIKIAGIPIDIIIPIIIFRIPRNELKSSPKYVAHRPISKFHPVRLPVIVAVGVGTIVLVGVGVPAINVIVI